MSERMDVQRPQPQELRRRKTDDVQALVVSLLFLGLGAYLMARADSRPWPTTVAVVVCGGSLLGIVAAMRRLTAPPGLLVLEESGFAQYYPPAARPPLEPWITCEAFNYVVPLRGPSWIVYTRLGLLHSMRPGSAELDEVLHLCREADGPNKRVAATLAKGRLRDQKRVLYGSYEKLTPAGLAHLLNQYQDAYGRGEWRPTDRRLTDHEREDAFLSYKDPDEVLSAYRRAFGQERPQHPDLDRSRVD
jgi:hypothetical protein